jgi:hypothetical protein
MSNILLYKQQPPQQVKPLNAHSPMGGEGEYLEFSFEQRVEEQIF